MNPGWWLFGLVGWWGAAELTVFESVGVAIYGDDLGVLDEAIDHGGDEGVVAEDFSPEAKGLLNVTMTLARSLRAEMNWKNWSML